MFDKLKKYPEFKKQYLDTLKYRFAFGSLELEGINDDLANTFQVMEIFNQLEAIRFMIDSIKDEELDHYSFTAFVCDLVSKITGGGITGFRTTAIEVNGSKVPRSNPKNIRMDLWYLIDDYNYQIALCDSDERLFEIEAAFHIRFLHIHPFEDGNGRTARILLAYHLFKHNKAPVIISRDTKKEYCNLIENSDVPTMANMFKNLSEKEEITIESLFNNLQDKELVQEQKCIS